MGLAKKKLPPSPPSPNPYWRLGMVTSGVLHTLLFAAAFWHGHSPLKKRLEKTPAKIVWMETVIKGEQTPENKLPGPIDMLPADEPDPTPPKPDSRPLATGPIAEKPKAVVTKKPLKKKPRKVVEEPTENVSDILAKLRKKVGRKPDLAKRDNFPKAPDAQENPDLTPILNPNAPIQPLTSKDALIFAEYRDKLTHVIIDNFVWLDQDPDVSALLSFVMNPDGSINNPTITEASGNPAFDRAALRALQRAQPFRPPPEEIADWVLSQKITVNFNPGKGP